MNWVEQKTDTRQSIEVTEDKARLLNEVKKDLPLVQKEADGGVKPFNAVQLQAIQGIGIFEAEFGLKGDDVIFHFWPWNYHAVERENDSLDPSQAKRTPAFKADFEKNLIESLSKVFKSNKIESTFDRDMGAFFVKVTNGGLSQFHRRLSIDAVTELYISLGGQIEG